MVVIAEREKINNISNINVWNQVFYENDLDSTETLLKDLELIKEAEENYNPDNCMSAKEAYYKGLEYINNLA